MKLETSKFGWALTGGSLLFFVIPKQLRMDDCRPNQELINGVFNHLADAKALVRKLYLKGNEHLCWVKTILQEKNGMFPVVMAEMKKQATGVINNVLAINISLLQLIEDTEVWMMSTSPLLSPPPSVRSFV